jgi:hypothetical protein
MSRKGMEIPGEDPGYQQRVAWVIRDMGTQMAEQGRGLPCRHGQEEAGSQDNFEAESRARHYASSLIANFPHKSSRFAHFWTSSKHCPITY